MIYGLETERDSANKDLGIPTEIRGIGATVNVDAVIGALTAIAKSIISPSLASQIRIRAVAMPTGDGPVLAVGIPRSLAAPHRVEQDSRSFWRRAERDKYEPDVPELRSMFLEGERWIDDVEAFRARRVQEVRLGQGGIPGLDRSSSTLLHVVPVGRFRQVIDLRAEQKRLQLVCKPPRATSWGDVFNFNGYALTASAAAVVHAYTQWFRFGGVEGYSSHFVVTPRTEGGQRLLAVRQIEDILVRQWMGEALTAMRDVLAQDPPYAVLISVCNTSGTTVSGSGFVSIDTPISVDEILLPPVLLESADVADAVSAVVPMLDILWQAGGLPGRPIDR